MNRLEAGGGFDHRCDQRQAGQTTQQRRAPIDTARHNQRGLEDDPVELARHQVAVALVFALRVGGAGFGVGADRGQLDDPPHLCFLAGVEQGACTIDMGGKSRVGTAVLQHAHAVDHRVDAVELPVDMGAEVGLSPDGGRIAAPRGSSVTCAADDLVAGGGEPGGQVGADEAIGSGDQNAH